MGDWRFVIYGIIALQLAALAETIRRRNRAAFTERLINVGIYICFSLIAYPPPVLRGAVPIVEGLAVTLISVLAVRWYGPWHKRSVAKSGPTTVSNEL